MQPGGGWETGTATNTIPATPTGCPTALLSSGPSWRTFKSRSGTSTSDTKTTFHSVEGAPQVWPITQFFSIGFFVKKIINYLPREQIHEPVSCRILLSFSFLPTTPSSRSGTLEGLFEPMRRHSRALILNVLNVCVSSAALVTRTPLGLFC